ncbi:ATP-dependent endonuclease [Amnibacterium setariae]|uniref:ATP-dependent endonuclease n=1 Tax=Amnibacterium setariae TaxID=2306585 RepID=UPI0018F4A9EC|nr:ATP-dependent endonuclease [Amnibacterium setariae]
MTDLLVLVEGESDAAVLRVLAARRGGDAPPVLPTGGASGVRRALRALPTPPRAVLALCDEAEAPQVVRALGPDDAVFVCRADLEDELIRALGVGGALAVLAATGDLPAFRTLQAQPAHRGRPEVAQLRRFIAAGSGRKARIDAALAEALPDGVEPPPLAALLDRAGRRAAPGG